MYLDNNWNPVTGAEKAGFLAQINPIDGKLRTDDNTTEVAWRPLPFYDTFALIRIQDSSWNPKKLTIYYLTDQGNLFRLNGTSPPIHEVNAKAPVKITDENVIEYLKFFCFFVRGEEGPFLIAEEIDGPHMPTDLDAKTRAVIEGTLRPASYEGKNEQGYWMCDAVVFYSNALFIANFAVQPSGMIEMLDDDPVAGDLTTRVDCPIAT